MFFGVDQFAEGVANFDAVDIELEAFREKRFVFFETGECGLRCGIIGDEDWRFWEIWLDCIEENFEKDVVPVLAVFYIVAFLCRDFFEFCRGAIFEQIDAGVFEEKLVCGDSGPRRRDGHFCDSFN